MRPSLSGASLREQRTHQCGTHTAAHHASEGKQVNLSKSRTQHKLIVTNLIACKLQCYTLLIDREHCCWRLSCTVVAAVSTASWLQCNAVRMRLPLTSSTATVFAAQNICDAAG
eukprot:GHRQ01026713.1.p1 GENE.GHRQ01026713.1~~GHRQ01026713.1.p1  ORF type:complete len:114 (-),score=25.61 GHRQ01026713.1:255-596(-)